MTRNWQPGSTLRSAISAAHHVWRARLASSAIVLGRVESALWMVVHLVHVSFVTVRHYWPCRRIAGRAADQVGHRQRPVFGRGQALVREARRDGLTGCGGQHSSNTSPAPGGPNTPITRTKRHNQAHVGTPAKMASQAPDKPIAGKAGCGAVLGRGSRAGDRPSEKRTFRPLWPPDL
jgi:hypothetical protein